MFLNLLRSPKGFAGLKALARELLSRFVSSSLGFKEISGIPVPLIRSVIIEGGQAGKDEV